MLLNSSRLLAYLESEAKFYLCRREDLNLHPLRDTHLKRTRIPIPPRLRI